MPKEKKYNFEFFNLCIILPNGLLFSTYEITLQFWYYNLKSPWKKQKDTKSRWFDFIIMSSSEISMKIKTQINVSQYFITNLSTKYTKFYICYFII